ncbi:GtrA family protein [Candidatus Pseudothioglobus singularis]|jgi:putative flippase GtrA|nr:GtrA family protein [Candidatus Pseudothioglobus singularis]
MSFIKYVFIGVSGYVVYLILLVGMVEILSVDPVLASLLSFTPILILSYILSYKWVFESNNNHKTTFLRYLLVVGVGLVWNFLIMYLTINWLNWWYVYSQALVVVVVPTSNYLLNHFWTFKKQ